MKYFSLLLPLLFFVSWPSFPMPTGAELLEKAIKYHDPSNQWNTKEIAFNIEERRPDGPSSIVEILIDLDKELFRYTSDKDTLKKMYEVKGDACRLALNDSETIAEDDAKKYRMTCDFAQLIRNYTVYLWGLPMKLKDPGTIVHEEVVMEDFQGVECYKMKVTYEAAVGKDTWYFYFKKSNYALHGYKFYKEESKNDGEYITLEGEEAVSKIKFPKARKWYYNKDDKFLGEDVMLSVGK